MAATRLAAPFLATVPDLLDILAAVLETVLGMLPNGRAERHAHSRMSFALYLSRVCSSAVLGANMVQYGDMGNRFVRAHR